MNVELIKAQDHDFSVVQNMIRFYVYDMSEFMGWYLPEHGLFGGVDDQPEYWGQIPEDPDVRWSPGWKGIAYIIRVDGVLAGFALVRWTDKGGERLYDIGEFFILRKFRRQRIGTQVAHTLFSRYPGQWQIRQMLGNKPAQHFWRAAVSQYGSGTFQEQREFDSEYQINEVVQRFDSRSKPQNA